MNSGDAQIKNTNIVEFAKKKRHIHLLEKLQKDQPLKPGEMKDLEKLENPGAVSENIVDSIAKVAHALDKDERTIRRWIKAGAPGKISENRYDFVAMKEWATRKKVLSKAKISTPENEWDERLKKSRAMSAELKYKKEMGEYIPKADMERILDQLILSFKRNLLSLPRTVAPQLEGLSPREIQDLLKTRIEGIITDFARGKKLFK